MFTAQRTWCWKKVPASDLIKQVPGLQGQEYAIRNRWNRLRDRPGPTNNNNNNLSSLLSPLPLPPPPDSGPFISHPPPFQPPPSVFNSFQPRPSRPDNSLGNSHIPAQLSPANFGNRDQGLFGNLFGSQAQTLTRETEKQKVAQYSVQKELDNTIYELPDPPKLEVGDGLLNSLGEEADDILEQNFVNKKQLEDAVLEQIKKIIIW